MNICRCRLLVAVAAIAMASAPAHGEQRPTLHTNESYLEEVTRATRLQIDDAMEVLAFVLDSLPDRVKVYPTENYYYFHFFHGGVKYAGNIRIEPHDDGGQAVHFTYYQDVSEWRERPKWNHTLLDAASGVSVEKLAPLDYRISYRGKSVVFALNDLSGVKPPPQALGPDETYIGPICDEAGIRFFLVYNSKLRAFHYVLDETEGVADEFFPAPRSDRILIGKRTGYAFYRDHHRERKILIGVYESNMRLNTYFDGPFDQLPDNFIAGETLRKAILEIEPLLNGRIDRFGSTPNGEMRYMIDPYLPYARIKELYAYDRCARKRVKSARYYDCFDYTKIGLGRAVPGGGGTRSAGAKSR
jgi:hypothetical protein